MRFVRTADHGPYNDTRRKRLALLRKQRLEREALPLFSEMIAEEQPTVDDVMAQRAVQWDGYQKLARDQRAAKWREGRRHLFEYGANLRATLRALWKRCPYPGTPEYFLDFLHGYDTGRIDPDSPPWVYKGPGAKAFDILPIINRSRERMGLPPISSVSELRQYGAPQS